MHVDLHDAASQSAGALSQVFLRLGREVLALQRADLLKDRGCNSVAHYGAAVLGIPAREAGAIAAVARKLESLPALRQAAETGTISWYALRKLVGYATPESDAQCVRLAREYTVEQLGQVLRDLAPVLDSDKKRETVVHWKLDVTTAIVFEKALRKLSEQSQRRLSINEGLQQMSTLVLTGDTQQKSLERVLDEAELDILADDARRVATLTDLPDEGTDEIPEIRLEKLCDLRPWEKNRTRMNPRTRHVTPAQRRDLLRRQGYRCATPGCPHTLWLQVHHVHYWYQGGRTVPQNLVILCSSCHKLIHEGHLVLIGIAPDGLEFRDRSGRLLRMFLPYTPAEWLEAYYCRAGPHS